MPVNPKDRPIEALREETIDQLVMNYGHGRLSLEAFERRLDEAWDSDDHDSLTALTEDLDLEVDAGYLERKRSELGSPAAASNPDDVEYLVNVFSGSDRKGEWSVGEEIRVITVFGGNDVDFTDARFRSRTVRIRLFCLFGGVDFIVPEGVNVTMRALCIFGATDNRAPGTNDPDAPRIIIDGFVMFGAADAKVRRPFKQRMREFADELRSMFAPERP